MSADDPFLSRWARRKAQVRSGKVEPEAAPTSPALPAAPPVRLEPASPSAAAAPVVASPPPAPPPALPTLDDVAQLTRSSDYSRFVQPGVDSGVKNAALKKLFSDPHFNVMDGLDTYIDDYGKPDPIPLAMLRQMNQAHVLGLFADEDEKNAAAGHGSPPASPDGAPLAAVAESSSEPHATGAPAGEPEARPDDDADLRLQQDDAAGRSGADPGPRA